MHTGDGEAFTFWKQQGTLVIGDTVEVFEPSDAFALMVHEVSRAIGGDEAYVFPWESSVRVAEIVEEIAQFTTS
jgi:hypothetical protein